MATLAAPKAVSPVIRFCRYAALISGIAYGSFRIRYLTSKEVEIQEYENKIRAIRDARLKTEKDRLTTMEMNNLAKEMGIKPGS